MIVAVVLLAGCVSSGPEFSTPIGWARGKIISDAVPAVPDEDVPTSLRLMDDGTAWLIDFPQGKTIERDDGTVCLDVSTSDRYTGDATWSAVTSHRFKLTFGDSLVHVSAGDAYFGDQNWQQIRIFGCGSPRNTWWMGLECGDTGSGSERSKPTQCRWDSDD